MCYFAIWIEIIILRKRWKGEIFLTMGKLGFRRIVLGKEGQPLVKQDDFSAIMICIFILQGQITLMQISISPLLISNYHDMN